MELRAAHVLITGASRGIGAAMAERFADAGANVSLAARSEGPLRELAERLGGEAHVADLAATDDRRGLIARVEAAGGPLDVLVNNAGVDLTGAFDKLSADELENVFLLNAVAPAWPCCPAWPPTAPPRRPSPTSPPVCGPTCAACRSAPPWSRPG
jgi:short-subunit dehydrogenase